ncbi:MAG: hypothetical protein R3B99_18085 [Polyangiales bacterium]
MLFDVPAIAAPRSRSLSGRRDSLVLPDDAVDALVRWIVSLRQGGPERWQALADAAGLPLGEVVASPFGLRAVALGVAAGATCAHVETRALLPWPERFGQAATADEAHGIWDAGRLHVGKYQSFQADAAPASFDPAHVAKWGPHEMLHRAVGFFFAPDATRFEHYLGARLNELLPVALWYGHDQVARLHEAEFVRADAKPEAKVEDAQWLFESEAGLKQRVRRTHAALLTGLIHFRGELLDVDREIATGRVVETTVELGGARLNAASDATAYVVGHGERLRDPIVSALLASLPESLGRFDSIAAFRRQVEQVHDRLLFERIRVDAEALDAARSRRTLWDWLHRAAHTGLDVRALVKKARPELAGEKPVDEGRWLERLVATLGEEIAGAVLADGVGGIALGQLREGLHSVTPRVEAALDDEALSSFATSRHLLARAPLARRLDAFLEDAEAPTVVRELATLERAIAEVRPNDEATHLSEAVPSRLKGGVVLANRSFRVVEATHDVVALHAGGEAVEGTFAWVVGAHDDGVSLLPCQDDELVFFRAAVNEAQPVEGAPVSREWLREALVAGALFWRPRATGGTLAR